jgi:prepilin-type N-terminal cleavage/methylation domain-containing protein
MEQTAWYSKKPKGYSLIEVLAAMLLMVIVLLALMESVVLYTQTNMRNILRDEAVRTTQDVLYGLRSKGFNNVATGTTTTTITRKLRSGTWDFDVTVTITDVDTQMKSALAVTSWTFLNSDFTHQASTLIPSQQQ